MCCETRAGDARNGRPKGQRQRAEGRRGIARATRQQRQTQGWRRFMETTAEATVRVELGGEVRMATEADWQEAADTLHQKYGGVPQVTRLRPNAAQPARPGLRLVVHGPPASPSASTEPPPPAAPVVVRGRT